MPALDVEFISADEGRCRRSLMSCCCTPFEFARPVRAFPSLKGQASFAGLWWSATTGRHVGYESWVERDVAMMLDFDPGVAAFSSQPFWLCWPGGQRERRHAPDFFARRADGCGVVVDVRPDGLVDPRSAESFAVMEDACGRAGWVFRRTGGPGVVLAANVRWLAAYRHPRCLQPVIADAVMAAFGVPAPLFAAAEAAGDRLGVLPVLFHLMWRGVLAADLAADLLGPRTVVRRAAEGWR
ncbi:MAG TPA: TnsA-like heteromeric transposase endonuclease subunit [Streptosporangiaceae bacterium]|nr:TnsA-like heteromeric transposase endonuclease subunit [Streptosporangiaceae bacterium]